MSNNKSKKKKSGGSPLPIIIFILIVGGVAASNFVGPAKGWMTGNKQDSGAEVVNNKGIDDEKGGENNTDTKTPSDSGETKTTDKGSTSDKNPDTVKSDPKDNKPKTEFELKHEEFMNEYFTKLKEKKRLPTIGRSYKVVTSEGTIRDGVYQKTEGYSLYLTKIKPYNANASIHYSKLRADMARYFFPEKAANTYANKMLEKFLSEKNVITAIEEEIPAAKEGDKPTNSTPVTTSKRISSKSFDPTVTESSPRLAHAAMEVNNYLRNQVRITKKRDKFTFADVEKGHAKQQGASAIFYMYVTPSFVSKSYEYKFQVIDGIRRFWALRCMSNGVAGDSRAFLCIVNGSKIIGGSKISSAEDIYIK